MNSSSIGAHRARSGAVALAAFLALCAAPASAGQPAAREITPDTHPIARPVAGQSWGAPKFSVTEMRPGTVEQGHFAKYIREVDAAPESESQAPAKPNSDF